MGPSNGSPRAPILPSHCSTQLNPPSQTNTNIYPKQQAASLLGTFIMTQSVLYEGHFMISFESGSCLIVTMTSFPCALPSSLPVITETRHESPLATRSLRLKAGKCTLGRISPSQSVCPFHVIGHLCTPKRPPVVMPIGLAKSGTWVRLAHT